MTYARVLLLGLAILVPFAAAGARRGPVTAPTLDDTVQEQAQRPPDKPTSARSKTDSESFEAVDDELFSPMRRAEVRAEAERAYRIGPGDGIHMEVLRHPEFDTESIVSASGTLAVPIVGEVKVAGQTAAELDSTLTEEIGRDYLVDPDVIVTITGYENMKLLVTGRVVNPGLHKLTGPVTLLEFLSSVGGFKGQHSDTIMIERIVKRRVQRGGEWVEQLDTETISTELDRLLQEGDLSQNIVLQHGDRIYVPPDDTRIYVFGEVQSPGFYRWQEGLTLYEVIKLAGGFTDFANPKKIRIRRQQSSDADDKLGLKEIRVNLKPMLKEGDISANAQVLDGDVILVGSSFFF